MAPPTSATPIPMPQSPAVNPKTGFATTEWYRYWSSPLIPDLSLAGITTDSLAEGAKNLYFSDALSFSALAAQLVEGANIQLTRDDQARTLTITSTGSTLLGPQSVNVTGGPAGPWTIALVGDSNAPGNTTYYGTGPSGAKGWFTVASALAGSANVTATVAANGVTSFNLSAVTVGSGGTLQKYGFDSYGRLNAQGAATTDNLTEGSTNLYYTSARVAAYIATVAAQPNGLATLDSSGKLSGAQLPAIAVNETYVVASQAAMLALAANVGDTAVRTDINETFILKATPASTLANWVQLLFPTSGVTSFNGRTGPVTPSAGDYTFSLIGGTAAPTQGGTGLTAYAIGDTLYGSNINTLSPLAGNTTTTRKFLRQTGTGTASAAPAWDTLVAGDIPALSYVTSVQLAAPTQFSVTGGPVTSSGTLTLAWNTQTANQVLAGPASGSAAAPTFRALAAADIPTLSYVTSVNASGGTTGMSFTGGPVTASGTLTLTGTLAVANGGTGATTSTGSGATVLGTTPTITTPNVVGVNNGSNAAAGSVGEYISASASSVALVAASLANIASISLTAGDWDVSGGIVIIGSAAVIANAAGGVSATSATLGPVGTYFQYADASLASAIGMACPTVRLSVAATTTVYLIAYAGFATGTATASGLIHARRMR
jgi:hypothetical protein